MSRIIAIASQKGGVGKTTTALNLGFSLSRFGQRVLLVDADPQGGIALASNLKRRTTRGLVQVLRGECALESVVAPTRDGTMAALGSGASDPLDAMELEDAARDGRLGALLRQAADGFGYVFLDAPAGVGCIVHALLRASHGVLLALRCQSLSVKSLPALLRLIRYVQEGESPGLRLEGAVLTLRDERSPSEEQIRKDFLASLPEGVVFRTEIRFDEAFERASLKALPVALLPEAQAAARTYMDLALEFRERETRRDGGGEEHEHVQGLF